MTILQLLTRGGNMARVVGKICRKKGRFYYIDRDGYIVEMDRSEMVSRRKMKGRRKRR